MTKQPLFERGEHVWSDDSIRLILTPSAKARSLYFYTQEVGYFKTSFPYFCERQHLDSFLIIYTVSGKGILKYEDSTYTITKGMCFLLNCEEHHLYRTAEHENWEILWLHFNGPSALGYYREISRDGFRIIDCQSSTEIADTIREIISRHEQKDSPTEATVSHLIDRILTCFLIRSTPAASEAFVLPDYIREIAREIDRNFRDSLTLPYFESKHHRSRFHISREFHRYMGITINEYLINTRISYAKELLKYTDMTIEEITYETGINHVSHFINLFKKREDMTPLKYRKLWRN